MTDDEPDWEKIARNELSSNLEAFLEMEIYENGYPIINALANGEPVEDEQVETLRSRFYEFDEHLTHARSSIGELDLGSDAERLDAERRALAHQFHRLARSARRDKLCQHELDRARKELHHAEQTLDSLEEEQEE